jgi:predicted aspartyl protease
MDRRSVLAGGIGTLASLGAPARSAPPSLPIVSSIALEQRRLWIAATIAGSKPLMFVIDTGAGFAYLRPEVARDLKLRVVGGKTLGGLGRKQVLGTAYLGRDVIFGGHLRQPVVGFAEYDFGRGLPPDAAGLLAAGLFTSQDSDLDFDKGEWRLWRDGRPDRNGFVQLDSEIGGQVDAERFSHRMSVNALLDGQRYRFILDTGSPGALMLMPRAAERCGLFKDGVPFAPYPTSGFGGAAAKLSRTVRARSFVLGPLSVDRPLVTVMDPDQRSRIEYDGLIGLPLISLLNLSTDVRARRVWAQRNGRVEAPETYRLAGLWLDKDKSGAAVVAVVGTGSPAAVAGVRQGDVVADPPSFEQAVTRIGGPPGREVTLGLRRGGRPVDVRYTLRPYL